MEESFSSPNTMLEIHEKQTTALDFYHPLRNYISANYSERDAHNVEDDLQTVKQYRTDLERHPDPSLTSRRDLLQNYYRCLCSIETRFPISSDNDSINTLSFVWHDAFKQKQKSSQKNLYLEKAAVVFNLGAVYSQIGLSFDRALVDGRKQASHAFIAAAGAFSFLKDNVSGKACYGGSLTVDLSVECAGLLERLMLAQAQECVFENSIAKGSSPGVCSKIARQVGLYYEEAFTTLNIAPLKDHFDKAWVAHLQLKAAIFYSEACYRCSLDLHEKEEIAEEIVRLNTALGVLAEAKKNSKGASTQLLDAARKLEVNLNLNLERAVRENDRVYLMRVPSQSSMPSLPAVSMVKPLSMAEVLDASNEKIFTSIIPDSSAKSLSRYTEMVDDIIRTQAERLQQGSEIARVRLLEMGLPDSICVLEGNVVLKTELKDDVEAVQVSGGPAGLGLELQQLRDLRRVNQELLVQTEEILQKEAMEDTQFRNQFGTQWTRPQSNTLTKNLQDRLSRFASNLKQAADSDARIEHSVKDHMPLMSILDCQPIESVLPTLGRPLMSLDANEDAVVGTLKQSLMLLEVLGTERAGLEDMLKDMKRKDDVLPKLMASSGMYEDLFRKEITKYDHVCEDIFRNIEAQDQLLLQIRAQNEEFSTVFNLEDYRVSREKCNTQIRAAIAKYHETKENINEGLKFYVTLQEAMIRVQQQCSDFVLTRNIQCQEMIENVQCKMAGLAFQDQNNAAAAYNYPMVNQPHQTPPSASLLPPGPSHWLPGQPPVSGHTFPTPLPPGAPCMPLHLQQASVAGWQSQSPYQNQSVPRQQSGTFPYSPHGSSAPYQGAYYKQ